MTQEEQIQFILDLGSRAIREVIEEIRARKPSPNWLSAMSASEKKRILSNQLLNRLRQYDSWNWSNFE